MLHHPWLLLGVGGIALALLLSEQVLPQLPTRLADDPAAAERWLISTGADYGAAGDLLLALDMFDLRHSLLLRILLAFVALLLAVRLADQIGAALQLRRVQQLAAQASTDPPVVTPGEPLQLPTLAPLYRLRRTVPLDPVALRTRADLFLATRFARITQKPLALTEGAQETASVESGDGALPDPPALRFLAWRNPRSAYLRPLLVGGLLLLLFVAWMNATFGWMITLSVLGPGETARYAAQQLAVTYLAPDTAGPSAVQDATLRVQVGDRTETISVATRTTARLRGVDLRAALGPPGLLVQSSNEILTLPGQSNTSAQVGLVFAAVGDEEFVLLPEPAIVLRILRGLDEIDPHFLVEVFEGLEEVAAETMQPSQRLEVRAGQVQTVTLRNGAIVLQLMPLPALQIEARYLPGFWLLLPALTLIVAGAVGYGRPPIFLVMQVAPWPPDRSVIVAQSNAQAEKKALRHWLAAQADSAAHADGMSAVAVEPTEEGST